MNFLIVLKAGKSIIKLYRAFYQGFDPVHQGFTFTALPYFKDPPINLTTLVINVFWGVHNIETRREVEQVASC